MGLLVATLLACSNEVPPSETDASDPVRDSGVAPDATAAAGLDATAGISDAATVGPDAATSAGADAGPAADAASCLNPCSTAGKKRCNGTKQIDTCTDDGNGCLQWVTTACPGTQTCSVMGSAMCM